MRIFSYSNLKKFGKKHSDCKSSLDAWYKEFSQNEWLSPHSIKDKYASASIVGNHRIVFNIKGNRYRLIVEFRYEIQMAFVRFIGTHTEYDKIDAETVKQF